MTKIAGNIWVPPSYLIFSICATTHIFFIIMDVDQFILVPLTRSSGLGQTSSLTQGPSDRHHATGVSVQNVTTPDSFSIDFCNIRSLRPNFSSVEQHLSPSSPDTLILSETQLSANISSDLF